MFVAVKHLHKCILDAFNYTYLHLTLSKQILLIMVLKYA